MDLFEKINETKKFAREKNVPNWYVCLLDAIVITVVLSSTLALYSYVAFDNMIQNMTYQPYWVKPVMVIIDYLPMVFAGLFLLKFDKLIMGSILFHSWLNRKMMSGIQKLDHKMWKKTGKDAWFSDKMWKATRLYAKLPKRQRKFLIGCIMALYLTWYVTQFML